MPRRPGAPRPGLRAAAGSTSGLARSSSRSTLQMWRRRGTWSTSRSCARRSAKEARRRWRSCARSRRALPPSTLTDKTGGAAAVRQAASTAHPAADAADFAPAATCPSALAPAPQATARAAGPVVTYRHRPRAPRPRRRSPAPAGRPPPADRPRPRCRARPSVCRPDMIAKIITLRSVRIETSVTEGMGCVTE